ncbi:PAP2-like protein, putative [Plasmodium relictum]|uniref:PAP2-like protein, putative n=1 Tax=Plasmodium relictum TaxID=85471 RepID=A0A1J1H4W6_PLARL|nr:PAP2-like protein, putative [Plasmodium relictum]CRG98475.1 PAP2-like protein, putative [Plasmodium relictum]
MSALIQFSYSISIIRCLSVIISLVLVSSVQGFHMRPYYRTEYVFDDDNNSRSDMKINLRSRRNFEPLFTKDKNDNKKSSNSTLNDGNDDKLLEKYPLCDAKYKLVDKLKVFKLFQGLIGKRKKLVLNESCIIEMYEFLSVTLKNTNDLLLVLAIVYGYVPLFLIFLSILGFFITYNKILLYFNLIIPTQIILNELILKNIIKIRRPYNSALESYGMPSGHSSFSFSFITFILLHLTESNKDKWNIVASILVLITLFPIPWSRFYIEDHTLSQVIVGCIIGIILGYLFFLIKKIFFK